MNRATSSERNAIITAIAAVIGLSLVSAAGAMLLGVGAFAS